MKTKVKRIVTDDQRAKLRENLARARATRAANIERARTERTADESSALAVIRQRIEGVARDHGSISTMTRDRTAEVQAVIETMTPERRAKLEAVQARSLARLAETREGLEAIERMEARRSGAEQNTVPQVQATQNVAVPSQINELRAVTEALARPPEPPKMVVREVPFKTPFRLTGSQSGMMISELGSCVCGEAKLKWHAICLKVKVNG